MPRETRGRRNAFECMQCNKIFQRNADLLRHMKTHDPNARRYRCNAANCKYSSLQKSNLKTHYTAVHLGMRPYVCNLDGCELDFGDHSALIRHEKQDHGHYRKIHGRPAARRYIHLDEWIYIKGVEEPQPSESTPTPPLSGPSVGGSPLASTSSAVTPSAMEHMPSGMQVNPKTPITGKSFPEARLSTVKKRAANHYPHHRTAVPRASVNWRSTNAFEERPAYPASLIAGMPRWEDFMPIGLTRAELLEFFLKYA